MITSPHSGLPVLKAISLLLHKHSTGVLESKPWNILSLGIGNRSQGFSLDQFNSQMIVMGPFQAPSPLFLTLYRRKSLPDVWQKPVNKNKILVQQRRLAVLSVWRWCKSKTRGGAEATKTRASPLSRSQVAQSLHKPLCKFVEEFDLFRRLTSGT